jgi:hypothetical protein
VKALFIGDMDLRSWNRRDERRTLSPLTNIFGLHRVECLYRGNSLLISWMKRPLGRSDPSSVTATVVWNFSPIRAKLLRPNQSRNKKIEVGRVDVADGDDE